MPSFSGERMLLLRYHYGLVKSVKWILIFPKQPPEFSELVLIKLVKKNVVWKIFSIQVACLLKAPTKQLPLK